MSRDFSFLVATLDVLATKLGLPFPPVRFRTPQALHPLRVRVGTSDIAVFRQIFCDREYDCLDEAAGPILIVDCGANVGYSSVYFLNRFPAAFVIAIEPFPANFEMLERNLAPYAGRFQAVRRAVWSRPARLCFTEEGRFGVGPWAIRVREADESEPAQIEATDLGSILAGTDFERIAILKIDVEGSEREIFARHYESWLPLADTIVIELHGEEDARIFDAAIAGQNFTRSRSGELSICKRR